MKSYNNVTISTDNEGDYENLSEGSILKEYKQKHKIQNCEGLMTTQETNSNFCADIFFNGSVENRNKRYSVEPPSSIDNNDL